MKKHRYRYRHEHLDFVKVKVSFREIILKVFVYILAVVFITIAYYIIYSIFFDTPEERGLKRENALLQEQNEVLKKKFDQIENIMQEIELRDKEIYKAIFHADLSLLNSAATLGQYDNYENIDNVSLIKETMLKMKDLDRRFANLSVMMEELNEKLRNRDRDSLLAIPLIQPIENKTLTRIGASIGQRMHPFYKLLKYHTGIDFVAGIGANVYATANGRVQLVQRSERGYGNKIEIDHGCGYTTIYAHLSDMMVKQGQQVERGQVIARVGNTGSSVNPHLHYEVKKNGNFMDPLNYFFIGLLPEEYELLIQLSTSSGQSLD
jgi:murein DD-endopeptidase MepM/ murein hydrolase activator NlpD